ncbi:BTAD domain-containing putative transcriptional regulator [Spirillospora sp. NPDC048911]|uniref:BTAD domain-containing putative transcriptional regulator n=1 Tax=Spirillospora sp. NPDC048911 TaxID=3364527 RepID=UPI00371B8F63
MTIELRVLTRVVCRGREITSPRVRDLLALLAGEPRTGRSAARLVEGLWPGRQPENPHKALQIIVSRARAQLGADLIESTPTGYRLTLDEERVDASAALVFSASAVRLAGAGDHEGALRCAEEGLALWEGAAEDASSDDPVSALRAEREPARRSLARVHALSLGRVGRRAEAVGPLAELLRDHPRDEEVLAELLRCEAAAAGPSAALERYEAYRRDLRDELGADPGSELREVHRRLLEAESPPVRHGVRHEPNPLLGRAGDIAAVARLLRTSRVTSIVGAGGLGKTRLAHAVSREAEQRIVHFVPLAGVRTDADVAGEVASALGVGDSWSLPGPATTEALAGILRALGPGSVLLVLDNCEQVIGGVADLVHALVSMSRNLQILTTSRAPLGLSSESVHPLPELSLPTAVELFEQRARAVRPDADLPGADVTEVCRHLDGLPLAVELAAVRVRVMSVAEISRRLADRFALLRGGARDAPERHHTLHAVVDWSWNLLTPDEQVAMRVLSIFPDGFTADAARRFLGDGVFDVLEHLVDQSLLKVTETLAGTRFRMLETVREFSAERRDAAGDTGRALEGFLGWARDFGAAEHEVAFEATVTEASVERLRAEQDNLLQALRHGFERSDGATVAAAFAVLGGMWLVESKYTRLAELAGRSARVLASYRPEPGLVDVTRTALTICAVSAFMQGPHELRSLAALRRRLPPASPDTLVGALTVVLTTAPGMPGHRALAELCESDEPLLAGVANLWASFVSEHEIDVERALKAAYRALAASERAAHPWMQLQCHSRLAELSAQVERGEQARNHVRAALEAATRVRPEPDVDGLGLGLVQTDLLYGDVDEAERRLDAVTHDSEEDFGVLPAMLSLRAEIKLMRGDVEAGLRLWRTAVEEWERSLEPLYQTAQAGREPWSMETLAAAVIAHAQHRRLDLIAGIVADLPSRVAALIADPLPNAPSYLVQFPIWGAGLLALAMVDLDRGAREGDAAAARSGVRLVALAERFGYLRRFHPTMSSARARRAAEEADGPAYADAVSAYAGLGRDELRAVALTAIEARPHRPRPSVSARG